MSIKIFCCLGSRPAARSLSPTRLCRNRGPDGSGIRVDFIFSFSPYARQAIERAKDIKLGRTSVRYASLEDVVVHKVIAGRARDLEDVRSILLKNPRYDSAYIKKWLKAFDQSLGGKFLKIFRNIEKEIP